MRPHHKKKAIIGVLVGLAIFGVALFLFFRETSLLIRVPLVLGGIGIYLWGCAALAKGKGYSGAILLTVVFGVLFPVVVLLALPDKNKHYKRR